MANADTSPAPEAPDSVAPPSRWWLLAEGRALGELATTLVTMPLLRRGPTGDGHPVLVLPGFMASDFSTGTLRRFLKRNGYAPHRWRLGRNRGPVDGVEGQLLSRLRSVRWRYGRKVSLVGWSLGGVYARMLANVAPQAVRSVITLGSPYNHDTKANHAWRLFEWVSGTSADEVDPEMLERIRQTPTVPTTSIYTKTDGITAWQCCVEQVGPRAENVAVPGSHCGLGANPLVLNAIADRLAQPEDDWKPFRRAGLRRYLYPEPEPA